MGRDLATSIDCRGTFALRIMIPLIAVDMLAFLANQREQNHDIVADTGRSPHHINGS